MRQAAEAQRQSTEELRQTAEQVCTAAAQHRQLFASWAAAEIAATVRHFLATVQALLHAIAQGYASSPGSRPSHALTCHEAHDSYLVRVFGRWHGVRTRYVCAGNGHEIVRHPVAYVWSA